MKKLWKVRGYHPSDKFRSKVIVAVTVESDCRLQAIIRGREEISRTSIVRLYPGYLSLLTWYAEELHATGK